MILKKIFVTKDLQIDKAQNQVGEFDNQNDKGEIPTEETKRILGWSGNRYKSYESNLCLNTLLMYFIQPIFLGIRIFWIPKKL